MQSTYNVAEALDLEKSIHFFSSFTNWYGDDWIDKAKTTESKINHENLPRLLLPHIYTYIQYHVWKEIASRLAHIPTSLSAPRLSSVPHTWLPLTSFSVRTSETKGDGEVTIITTVMTITVVSLKWLSQAQPFLPRDALPHHSRACFRI